MASSPWGAQVDNAIREAYAANERPSTVLRKLRAGTLEGIGEPTPLPERTFYSKWSRIKREQRTGSAYSGPSLLHCLWVDLVRTDTRSDNTVDIAVATGLDPKVVRECLAMCKRAEEGGPRVADQVAARRGLSDPSGERLPTGRSSI